MRPFNGYPTSFGNVKASLVGIAGPASYTVVTVGSTPTGGQVVQANQFGTKNLDVIFSGISDSGRFLVEGIPVTPTVGAPQAAAGTTYRLRWVSRVTASFGGQSQVFGTEAIAATDLSTETVRLFALGLS